MRRKDKGQSFGALLSCECNYLGVNWIGPVGFAGQVTDKLSNIFHKLLKICPHNIAISVFGVKAERGWSADVHLRWR